jgi:hypothetical protein
MKRLITILIGAGLAAAACSPSGAQSLGPAPSGSPIGTFRPTTPPSPSPTRNATPGPTTPSPSPTPTSSFTYQVWFSLHGKLFVTKRTSPFTVAVGRLALTAMLEGPSTAEASASVRSAIPAGTSLLGLSIGNGLAKVDLSSEFESNPTSKSMPMAVRLAQVIYTISQYPNVGSVQFAIEGQSRTTVGGVPVQTRQSRAVYASFLPAILVQTPLIGARVSSPVTISGTANVFEATVSLRILDADGHEIARTFTQASCGTGCRGDYSVAVPYEVSTEQQGTIEVFESSAKDGSAINVVAIPVTLTA